MAAGTAAVAEKKGGIDVGLMVYFALWYLGNYYYNITNKLCLKVRRHSGKLPKIQKPSTLISTTPAASFLTPTHTKVLATRVRLVCFACAQAAGGAAGFPMTLSCLQLGVGVIYAMFLWAAPDARTKPKVTFDDVKKMLPVGVCMAGAHAGSVFALGAGAVSFAQIVKSAEPAFAAVVRVTH
jgi:solute carrier family 35 protein E1